MDIIKFVEERGKFIFVGQINTAENGRKQNAIYIHFIYRCFMERKSSWFMWKIQKKTMNPETAEIPEAAIVDIKFYIKKTTFIKKCLGFIVWQMNYNRPSDAGDTSLGL